MLHTKDAETLFPPGEKEMGGGGGYVYEIFANLEERKKGGNV